MLIPRITVFVCNICSSLLILTSCIFCFYQIHLDFFFPTLIISIYGLLICGIILSMMFNLKNSPLYCSPLEDINNQMSALFLFSFLLIQTSIAGTICGSILVFYSMMCFILNSCSYIEAEQNT